MPFPQKLLVVEPVIKIFVHRQDVDQVQRPVDQRLELAHAGGYRAQEEILSVRQALPAFYSPLSAETTADKPLALKIGRRTGIRH